MKKTFAVFMALLCILFVAGTLKTENNNGSVFGLLIVDDLQLDPACKYSNGKFEDVSTYPDSSEPHSEFILNTVKDFAVFKRGVEIGKFSVTRIEKGGLNCYGFLAGYGKCDISDSVLNANGHKLDFLPVLSVGSKATKTQKNSAPVRHTLSRIQREKLLEIARQKFLQEKVAPEMLKDIKIESSLSYDLDGDGVIEHFMKTSIEVPEIYHFTDGSTDTSTTTKIALIWTNIGKEKVAPISISAKRGKFEYWGDAWNLVDVLDIDGDGISEAIFEAYGEPEYSYFQIYQFTKNGFQLVYFGAGSGC